MKKFLFALLTGCIPALIATNGAYAQNLVNTEILEPQKNITAIEKEVPPANDKIVGIGAISPKALKDFTKTYKNVIGESWWKVKDGSATRFIINGVMNSIYYNTKGRWTGSVKGYSEDKMPHDIRDIVKREYYEYSIIYVEEVETIDSHGIPTYVIHLEDKNNIKLVRIGEDKAGGWNLDNVLLMCNTCLSQNMPRRKCLVFMIT
jgi:hypothetical protein